VRGVFLTFKALTLAEFLEKHDLFRSKYPDVSLGNPFKDGNKMKKRKGEREEGEKTERD
jgi:hypothetical protein